MELAKPTVLADHIPLSPKGRDLIFATDVQYSADTAFVAVDVRAWEGDFRMTFLMSSPIEGDYEPGFFYRREGPVLANVLRLIKKQFELTPYVVLVDGHGMAHPDTFGLACWLGTQLHIRTIGCAKQTMLPYEKELLNPERGSTTPILLNHERVGLAVRTQTSINPVFVSVGHQVSLKASADLVLFLSPIYRIPEPLRCADQAARRFATGIVDSLSVVLESDA